MSLRNSFGSVVRVQAIEVEDVMDDDTTHIIDISTIAAFDYFDGICALRLCTVPVSISCPPVFALHRNAVTVTDTYRRADRSDRVLYVRATPRDLLAAMGAEVATAI